MPPLRAVSGVLPRCAVLRWFGGPHRDGSSTTSSGTSLGSSSASNSGSIAVIVRVAVHPSASTSEKQL